jgi:hypothetical protein
MQSERKNNAKKKAKTPKSLQKKKETKFSQRATQRQRISWAFDKNSADNHRLCEGIGS